MPIIKSFAVGNGDMFYVKHGGDSFTIIDCNLSGDASGPIIEDIKRARRGKTITRFICTHPDEDHFGGIELLDAELDIRNFYCVKNQAVKDEETASFAHYCGLRDSDKAFFIYKGCKRRWLNEGDDERRGAGIQVLWPDTSNADFKAALAACDAGESYNNTSAVLRYHLNGGASFMWLGDLETEFMESIKQDIELKKTTVVFASHHGRQSGKIPDSWLEKLDPQVIIIGESPSRHLHYYTGYKTITQNSAGDITMHADGNKVHFYSSNPSFGRRDWLDDEGRSEFDGYIGSLTVETEYTL